MAKCPQCGADCEADGRYCPQCGSRLSSLDVPDGLVTRKTLDVVDVRYRLGMVYFKQGQYGRAVAMWEKILADRPGDQALEKQIQDAKSRCEASGEKA